MIADLWLNEELDLVYIYSSLFTRLQNRKSSSHFKFPRRGMGTMVIKLSLFMKV